LFISPPSHLHQNSTFQRQTNQRINLEELPPQKTSGLLPEVRVPEYLNYFKCLGLFSFLMDEQHNANGRGLETKKARRLYAPGFAGRNSEFITCQA
jgi:hypothetical protein